MGAVMPWEEDLTLGGEMRPKDEETYVTDTQKCGAEKSMVPRAREHRNGNLTMTESLCFLWVLFNRIVLP